MSAQTNYELNNAFPDEQIEWAHQLPYTVPTKKVMERFSSAPADPARMQPPMAQHMHQGQMSEPLVVGESFLLNLLDL